MRIETRNRKINFSLTLDLTRDIENMPLECRYGIASFHNELIIFLGMIKNDICENFRPDGNEKNQH